MLCGLVYAKDCKSGSSLEQNRGLDKLSEEVRLEPANLLVGLPEFASLIDVDLARLLGVCLTELLADSESVDAGHEDPSLTAEVGGACETKRRGKVNFSLVQ